MEEISLDVQVREEIGRRRIKPIRAQGFIPAIVYGLAKKKPTSIKVELRSYEKIMRTHKGQSVLFHLNVHEGDKKLRDYSAIVKEEQLHPVSDNIVHVDFLRVSLKEEIEVKVPIESKGEAVGVQKDGGTLDQQLHEIDVVCLPTNIPQKLVVDVSELEIGSAVHVSDLKLGEGVTTKHDPEAMIFSVVPPMREEEAEPTEVDTDAEPEVTKEKKEKEESAEDKPAEKEDTKEEKSKG